MTEQQKRENARKFVNTWLNKGFEKGDTQRFWMQLLYEVLGMENVADRIAFEKPVIIDGSTKYIDAYIPETSVLIEQKGKDIDLDKKAKQSDGRLFTPAEQGKRYGRYLPKSEQPRWVISCNFKEFRIYDMEKPNDAPESLLLENLQNEYYRLGFLLDVKNTKVSKELQVSVKAGEIVGILYDELLKQYKDPTDPYSLHSLNVLCVRLVFCLYAEDAGIFGHKRMFHDYMERFETRDFRRALMELFSVLDIKPEERDPYLDESLAAFPFVNGSLFDGKEVIEVPQFTDEIIDIILNQASSDFDWSEISPTIFGAVFESTLNPETRRSGGMHYTSIENIHKVINPLFLEELRNELEEIKEISVVKMRIAKLVKYQEKLASLNFLDPACGSGNFLTESYICIRRLENEALKLKADGQIVFGEAVDPIKVSIGQFYGIEINDFAVTVAKTALWIAESQMMKETEDIIHQQLDFLPLESYACIVEGNALRIGWNDIIPKGRLNYIIGNPPFVGYTYQNAQQREDMKNICIDINGKTLKGSGKMDYVSAWYYKTASFIQGTSITSAFVSTNSITQGEQVTLVWKCLMEQYNIKIIFANRTFKWESEASGKAAVYCVIIGFKYSDKGGGIIYDGDDYEIANNISPYLINAENVFLEVRRKPLCEAPLAFDGNRPSDGGNLIIEGEDYHEFIKEEPRAEKYIKRYMMAREFLYNKERYCLWLKDCPPNELKTMPLVLRRIEAVRETRLSSPDKGANRLAETPSLFRELRNPKEFLVIPYTSSENRRYIPIGYLHDDTIIGSGGLCMIQDASLYHLGVITSNVHMAWMRTVAGRLKSDYRYSITLVYNNFPWCDPTPEQKEKIEQTAQGILDARAIYQESSLADLYDPLTMPLELRKAHTENDKAVMKAYDFSIKEMSEADCVARLMERYQDLVEK